jgi:NhaP-type Na+/H+ or K+/H+ antiporter
VLALVLLAFSVSNVITHESGLLAVTIMGIALGNMRGVHIDDILDFKETSHGAGVGAFHPAWPRGCTGRCRRHAGAGIALFLMHSWSCVRYGDGVELGQRTDWRERALIGWVAPRGIVAASVSALFALRLNALGVAGGDALVPLVFILIIGTVVLQSATARPLARG